MRPLAVHLPAALALPLSVGACDERCAFPEEHPSVALDLDAHADLLAIVYTNNGDFEYLAVGEAGTVIAWGPDPSGTREAVFTERFVVGDQTLRAAWVDRSDWNAEVWWVVGDGGFVGVSEDLGQSWTLSMVGDGTTDLLDITGTHANRPVVVADEAVFVGRADGTWATPPTPEGGWGALRAVACDFWRCVAVGLGGVVWETSDPLAEWTAIDIKASVDLFDVESDYFEGSPSIFIVGANGTMIVGDEQWIPMSTGVRGDLIAYHQDYVLGCDGELYGFADRRLTLIEHLPGALALHRARSGGAITVGEPGTAAQPPREWQCD